MQPLHLVIGGTTVSSLHIEHGLVLIMAGSEESTAPTFGCEGHGGLVFFVIAFIVFLLALVFFGVAFIFFVLALVFFEFLVGVTTTVGAFVDFGSDFGCMMLKLINPVILGRRAR